MSSEFGAQFGAHFENVGLGTQFGAHFENVLAEPLIVIAQEVPRPGAPRTRWRRTLDSTSPFMPLSFNVAAPPAMFDTGVAVNFAGVAAAIKQPAVPTNDERSVPIPPQGPGPGTMECDQDTAPADGPPGATLTNRIDFLVVDAAPSARDDGPAAAPESAPRSHPELADLVQDELGRVRTLNAHANSFRAARDAYDDAGKTLLEEVVLAEADGVAPALVARIRRELLDS